MYPRQRALAAAAHGPARVGSRRVGPVAVSGEYKGQGCTWEQGEQQVLGGLRKARALWPTLAHELAHA